jgi:opacity protein-like surface antigen
MKFLRFTGIILAAGVCLSNTGPASAAQLYDMSQFLKQGHPFAQTNTYPTAVVTQPTQPAAPKVKARSASATSQPSAPASLKSEPGTGSRWYNGLYASLNLQGGYSNIGDRETTNITGVTDRRVNDWVGGNSGSIGYNWKRFGVPLRTETEFFIRYRFDLDYRGTTAGTSHGYTNEVATFGGMVNLFYDFDYSWKKIRPYVGGGAGIARHWSQSVRRNLIDNSTASQDTRTNALTWAAMIGLNYEWKKHWLLKMEGRYQDFGEVESGPFGDADTITGNYTTTDLLLGVVYTF